MLSENSVAPSILVVEDDSNHAELIQRSFEDSADEYRLVFAESLADAQAAAERTPPNLVLTDYRLPDGYGSELVVSAAGLWPVIMMTSHGSEQVAVDAMKVGAQDYIVKSPDAFENLPRTVKYALLTWALVVARRQAADAVIVAKRAWERTFDAVPDLIAIIDVNHTITSVNKAMAERCGLSVEEIVGRKCHETVHGLHQIPCCCPSVGMLRDGLVHCIEIEEPRFNGFFDVTVSPLCDEEGRIVAFVHVMRDITERKKTEEERQKLEAQFQQTQKLESLGVLAGGIAHDFNNILTIILGHCYMVREDFDSGMTPQAHVEKIEGAANRAADLCRQMLAYAGNSPQCTVQINLWLLIDEIVKMLQSVIKKNVTIHLDLKRDVPVISGDNAHIQQIIMNLIINAAEAIGDKNGTITVTLKNIEIIEEQSDTDFMGVTMLPGKYAFLDVSDTGCGMDAEVVKRIFEPFFTTKFAGRGLGMSAILGIIKSHNGYLQMSSTPDVGTTFKVYFPLPAAVADVESAPSPLQTSFSTAGGFVLLVDDEDSLRTIGTVLLGAMGFTAIVAANGNDALGLYSARLPEIDLVMLDLIMPEMGGIETYHELRRINSTVPIIICSGYGVDSVSEIIATDDYAGFLHKPYNPAELCKVLREMIGEKD